MGACGQRAVLEYNLNKLIRGLAVRRIDGRCPPGGAGEDDVSAGPALTRPLDAAVADDEMKFWFCAEIDSDVGDKLRSVVEDTSREKGWLPGRR
jgi:hypothetical protein